VIRSSERANRRDHANYMAAPYMLAARDFLAPPVWAYLHFLSSALEFTTFFTDGVFDGRALTGRQSPETERQAKTQICELEVHRNPGQHCPSGVTRVGAESKDILFSVRPVHAEKILKGKKTVEVRRRFSHCLPPGIRALIYSTSPIQALIGAAEIRTVERLPLEDIWERHGQAACIGKEEFEAYFSGCKHGYAILLERAKPLERPLPLSELRERFGLEPPQSYLYASRHLSNLFENEQPQSPYRY
jgi:predicted transcriptional regulator